MNLDDLSLELSKSMIKQEEIAKAAELPPILAYKLRQWMRRKYKHGRLYGNRSTPISNRLSQTVAQKIEEFLALRDLKKNEFIASEYDNGEMKFDFGSAVPEKVKKMALAWAKKKGLKPTEVSLNKSKNTTSSVLCSKVEKSSDLSLCLKRVKFQIP